jgi:aminomethyltransferase
VVVNAANVEKDWRWLLAQQPSGCGLHDLSDRFALVALQGPKAETILQGLTPIDLTRVAFYRFAEGRVGDAEAIVARTGYTGEDGFEVFVAPGAAPALWRAIVAAGRPHGLVPAGLGARDTLRLEARMMLYGNDMDETTTLIEAGLGWIVSLDEAKGEWNGRAVLAEQKARGAPRKLTGFEMVERGIPRHGYPVVLDGKAVSTVTSGTFAPFLQKSIGLAYLPAARATVGTELAIDIRGRRTAARVVATPFYKRPR